ncbi:MAG: IS1182 family transposase [archaeon]
MAKRQLQSLLFGDKKIFTTGSNLVKKPKVVFKPYVQNQEFLLPKNIEEEILEGHVCRLISDIVDNMDLSYIFEKYKGGGASAYNPKMLLKVWILGFVNKIYSSRFLAKVLRENVTFMWISGKQTPDFHTLNNFRRFLGKDIKKIFKEIVIFGINEDVISGKDIFVDHTKIEANANRYKIVWRKQVEKRQKSIDEELDKLFDYADEINEKEDKIFGNKDLPEKERSGFDKDKIKEIVDKINKKMKEEKISRQKGTEIKKNIRRTAELICKKQGYSAKKQILGERNSYSKTDIDAVAMMMKDKKNIKPAYNEGVAVENGFVVNYLLDDNCNDSRSFIPLMDGTINNLGKSPETATADAAYGNEENHAYLEKKNIENYLKYNTYHIEKKKSWQDKKLRSNDFLYDKEKDEFTCKNNVKLVIINEFEDITKTGYIKKMRKYQASQEQCKNCPFKEKCTESEARTIHIGFEAERLKNIARKNLDSEKGKQLRSRRGNEVESVFGDEKINNKMPRFLLRGIKKVNIEAGLYFIAHNIKKIKQYSVKRSKNNQTNSQNLSILQKIQLY